MLTHVTVGTDDLAKGKDFYDSVMGALGHKRLYDGEDRAGYGTQAIQFMIVKPIDGNKATAANGGTIGLVAPSRKAVDEFHKQALAKGGKCAGAPGPRQFHPDAYAAYIRDPLGNKLAAVCMAKE